MSHVFFLRLYQCVVYNVTLRPACVYIVTRHVMKTSQKMLASSNEIYAIFRKNTKVMSMHGIDAAIIIDTFIVSVFVYVF